MTGKEAVLAYPDKSAMWIEGKTGVRYNTIMTAARRMGVKLPLENATYSYEGRIPMTPERAEKIKAYRKTHTLEVTCKEFKVSYQTMKKLCPGAKKIIPDVPPGRIEKYVKDNLTQRNGDIAKHLGCTVSSVSNARAKVQEKLCPVEAILVMDKASIPLRLVRLPYRYDDEWVVDMKGLEGVHRNIPITSVAKPNGEPMWEKQGESPTK